MSRAAGQTGGPVIVNLSAIREGSALLVETMTASIGTWWKAARSERAGAPVPATAFAAASADVSRTAASSVFGCSRMEAGRQPL